MTTKFEGYDNEVYAGKDQADLFVKFTPLVLDYLSQEGLSILGYILDNHKYFPVIMEDLTCIFEGGDE